MTMEEERKMDRDHRRSHASKYTHIGVSIVSYMRLTLRWSAHDWRDSHRINRAARTNSKRNYVYH